METRKITVVNTRTQSNTVINTNATTLGELMNEFTSHNIDTTDMDVFEGLSRTKLIDETSLLPTNVMYNGNPTNNLVILLTNSKGKIKAGYSELRSNLYTMIISLNLSDAIKEEFGKNFTNVSTDDLDSFVKGHTQSCTYNHTTTYQDSTDQHIYEIARKAAIDVYNEKKCCCKSEPAVYSNDEIEDIVNGLDD